MEPSERAALYAELKVILEEEAANFTMYDNPGRYSLYTKKLITVNGKKPEEQYFGGLRENKSTVSFYLMALYIEPKLREQVPASLAKILNGLTCFNFKKLSPELAADLRTLIQIGKAYYQNIGWLD